MNGDSAFSLRHERRRARPIFATLIGAMAEACAHAKQLGIDTTSLACPNGYH